MEGETNLPSASKFPKVNVIPNLIGLKKTSIDCTKHKKNLELSIVQSHFDKKSNHRISAEQCGIILLRSLN